jgi:hypothetical protein
VTTKRVVVGVVCGSVAVAIFAAIFLAIVPRDVPFTTARFVVVGGESRVPAVEDIQRLVSAFPRQQAPGGGHPVSMASVCDRTAEPQCTAQGSISVGGHQDRAAITAALEGHTLGTGGHVRVVEVTEGTYKVRGVCLTC